MSVSSSSVTDKASGGKEEPRFEEEPLWRSILNWGCVVYFLGLPAMAVFYGATDFTFGGTTPNAANFLREFHFAVTALVATIAGLNSFDRYKTTKNGTHDPQQKKL